MAENSSISIVLWALGIILGIATAALVFWGVGVTVFLVIGYDFKTARDPKSWSVEAIREFLTRERAVYETEVYAVRA